MEETMIRRPTKADGIPMAFFDVETTGLQVGINEIIEIGLVRESARGGDNVMSSVFELAHRHDLPEPEKVSINGRVFSWTCRIKPEFPDVCHPSSYRINGYNEQEWSTAPSFATVAPILDLALTGCVVVGSKPDIDVDFVIAGFERIGRLPPRIFARTIDTRTLAWEHLTPLGLRRTGLDDVCDFLGIDIQPRHRALPDAQRAREVYRILCRAGPLDKLALKLRRLRQEKNP